MREDMAWVLIKLLQGRRGSARWRKEARDGGTDERTRASEVSPAMAIPMWSSILMSFFWYEASSPVERWKAGESEYGLVTRPLESSP